MSDLPFSRSGTAIALRIWPRVPVLRGSHIPSCRCFRARAFFRLTFNAMVYRSSRPGSSRRKLHTYRSLVPFSVRGLRLYPTIFGFRHLVSSERMASGFTQKTLVASPGISKATGASAIAIRRQSAERLRPRPSTHRIFPTPVLSLSARRSMERKSA